MKYIMFLFFLVFLFSGCSTSSLNVEADKALYLKQDKLSIQLGERVLEKKTLPLFPFF